MPWVDEELNADGKDQKDFFGNRFENPEVSIANGIILKQFYDNLLFKELPTCSGCDPDDPTTAIADSNMIAECAVNNLNKNKCTLKCSNGGTIFGRNKVKMTCKCPRINGVKTCGWTMFKSQLSSTAIAQLTCDGGTSTVTSAPTTVAGDSTAVVTGTGMTPSDGSTTVAGDTVASTAAAGSTASMESTASGDTTALGDSTSSAESAAPGDTTAMNASTAPGDTTAPGDSTAQAGSTGPSDTTAAPSAAETVTSAATNAAQTTSMLVTR